MAIELSDREEGETKMSCKYKDRCPSYSRWCEKSIPDYSRCVDFILSAYTNEKTLRTARECFEIQSGILFDEYIKKALIARYGTEQQDSDGEEKDVTFSVVVRDGTSTAFSAKLTTEQLAVFQRVIDNLTQQVIEWQSD